MNYLDELISLPAMIIFGAFFLLVLLISPLYILNLCLGVHTDLEMYISWGLIPLLLLKFLFISDNHSCFKIYSSGVTITKATFLILSVSVCIFIFKMCFLDLECSWIVFIWCDSLSFLKYLTHLHLL